MEEASLEENIMLPKFEEFKGLPYDEQAKVLTTLFEHSDSLLWFTLSNRDFMTGSWKNYSEFVEAIRDRMMKLCKDTEREGISSRGVDHLANIVAAHPRLGESKAKLSIHSLAEQTNLSGSEKDTADIVNRLEELNTAYEAKYEGLRFVVFVNGRSRPEIIKLMESRICSNNSWFKECEIATNEMCDIAHDRVNKYGMIKNKI